VFSSGGGDGSADGHLDGNDIQGLVDNLVGGGSPSAGYCVYDMNADGAVSVADVQLFVAFILNG
jgi:hypothetical protein